MRFGIYYNVGSIDEVPGKTGIAHLLEHTMFLGSEGLKKDDIHTLATSAGGTNNATTSPNRTFYYEELPSAKLELAMAMEASRMRHLSFEDAEFEREKKVVMQERRQSYENNLYRSSWEKVQAAAFENSYLYHPNIGWMEDIESITPKDIKDFYKKYYAPNNAVMVVSGDADPKEVLELAKKYYSHYKPQKIERSYATAPEQKEEKFIKIEKMTNVPIIMMMYKTPKGSHVDFPAIDIFTDILVNGTNSRAHKKLKVKEKLVLEAGGFIYDMKQPGYALLYFVVNGEENLDTVKDLIDAEIADIALSGVVEKELLITKKSTVKRDVFSRKDINRVADNIATGYLYYGDPDFYEKQLESYKKVSNEDIKRVAATYFKRERRTTGYIVRKKEEGGEK